jgi:hypothetical protein
VRERDCENGGRAWSRESSRLDGWSCASPPGGLEPVCSSARPRPRIWRRVASSAASSSAPTSSAAAIRASDSSHRPLCCSAFRWAVHRESIRGCKASHKAARCAVNIQAVLSCGTAWGGGTAWASVVQRLQSHMKR